ncbi:MAG: Asp-tRNA(Asn)/Glu-tRNA(Gln) amidotransferase subunit GatB [Candidatus Omnitrophica bacterium]|jgi:aspartyl-tRNA(Asn)/glutamyl-tRNA(Gln) amidotransferase subunit B|nr:Asp-tRNA(Asn)/Glu-tRNA(Gln) amidotransferase subunit GatB [Candidatus Omnitrophota bacterium]
MADETTNDIYENKYKITIGLEIHVELLTESKMFCSCSTKFGEKENSQVCPVCVGLPGSLPVFNYKTLELGIKTALALNCQIPSECVFVRKSYFYPDLPKNFQISQYNQPLAINGYLNINNKKTPLRRIHLEEDTGKLIHSEHNENISLVDFNRAGVPLMEIVTEPGISSPQEAEAFLLELKKILQYIEVSDCNMEEGSLRCDANISVNFYDSKELGTKTEIKNMNSFKSVRKALQFESVRQMHLLETNKKVIQETRLWDETNQTTESMRTKEEAHDYRYFPEPDLLPIKIPQDIVEKISLQIGEIPAQKQKRFLDQYNLSEYNISVLTSEKKLADYFEETVSFYKEPEIVSNWIQTVLLGILKERNISIKICPISSKNFAELIELVNSKKITATSGKEVLTEMLDTGKSAIEIVNEKHLIQVQDEKTIRQWVKEVITEYPKAVKDYWDAIDAQNNVQASNISNFLKGMVMKKSKGKADILIVAKILMEELDNVRAKTRQTR